ncbi:hypothetical protein [Sphingomonas soli]|uniref:hypothetical protein n=1 Tax=Sphingomonas soli TaxID=266127 RepID=UPI00083067FD|nr:hypothetical protein [Sphingomonas soli]
MPRFNERLFDKLDAAAERTGVPAPTKRPPRRRHLRWWPIIALVLGATGLALSLARGDLFTVSYTLVMAGFALSMPLPMAGPVKAWGGPDIADEFDRAMRLRAFLATFASISVMAVIGIWLILGLNLLGAWPKQVLIGQISNLSLFLMTLYSAVPTLYASWATQPIGEEE